MGSTNRPISEIMLPNQQAIIIYITIGSDIMTSYTIYQHIFPDGKQYIGITRRQPEVRWGPGGYHYKNNPPMWKAIQEVGWDNIQHIILETNVSEEEVSKKERQYIKQYDSINPDKGYNRQRGGVSGESFYYDEDQIIELYEEGLDLITISQRIGCCPRTASEILHKYGASTEELKRRALEVLKANPKILQDWDTFYDLYKNQHQSLISISKETGWSYAAVRRAFSLKNIKVSHKRTHTISEKNKEEIRQYILSGKKIGEISNIYNDTRAHTSSFIHTYLPEMIEQVRENQYQGDATTARKPVCQYTLDGQYIQTFSSIAQAESTMKALYGQIGHIRDVLKGRRNQACGYFWRYESEEGRKEAEINIQKQQQARAEQGFQLEEVLQKYQNIPMCAQYKEAIINECKQFLRNAHNDTDYGLPYIIKCAKELGWQYKRVYLTPARLEKYNLPQELLRKECKYFCKD